MIADDVRALLAALDACHPMIESGGAWDQATYERMDKLRAKHARKLAEAWLRVWVLCQALPPDHPGVVEFSAALMGDE